MFTRITLLSIFIFLPVLSLSAQTDESAIIRKINSLRKESASYSRDTNLINALNTLGWRIMYYNPDSAILLGKETVSLSKKSQWKKGIANSMGNLGYFYYIKGDFTDALSHYFSALKIDEELKNSSDNAISMSGKRGMAVRLGNIAIVYSSQADYPKALSYYFRSLKMREELGAKNLIASCLGNIGNIYNFQGHFPKALDYYFKALKLSQELGNKSLTENWLNNIGNVYLYQADDFRANPAKSDSLLNKALVYYLQALMLSEELANKSSIATVMSNIGNVYSERSALSFMVSGKMGTHSIVYEKRIDSLRKKAMEFYFRALQMNEELGDKNGIANILGNIGSLYKSEGKFKDAENYLIKALTLCDSINLLDYTMQFEQMLSQLYDTLAILKEHGKTLTGFQTLSGFPQPGFRTQPEFWQLAYVHYKKYSAAKDSIYNEEKAKDIGRLEQKHEYEMTELKRQQEEKEKSRQLAVALSRRNTLEYSAILMGIFALFVIVFFVTKFNLPSWIVELAVFIPFLILFEFILVLLDPYIEHITKGEPVWKLLVNAVLAAVIFPIHAFFERMLKKRIGRSHSPEASD